MNVRMHVMSCHVYVTLTLTKIIKKVHYREIHQVREHETCGSKPGLECADALVSGTLLSDPCPVREEAGESRPILSACRRQGVPFCQRVVEGIAALDHWSRSQATAAVSRTCSFVPIYKSPRR